MEAELSTLSEGLKRRQLIAASRSLLELMQDTAHVMNKVRKGCKECTLQVWVNALEVLGP